MRRDIEQSLISWGSDSEPRTLSAKFCFDASLEVFKGHFPEMPLLPGVMQIEMVRFLVEKGTGHAHRILRIKKAKFIGQVLPGDQIDLTVRVAMQEGALRVKAKLVVNNSDVTSIIMDLWPARP